MTVILDYSDCKKKSYIGLWILLKYIDLSLPTYEYIIQYHKVKHVLSLKKKHDTHSHLSMIMLKTTLFMTLRKLRLKPKIALTILHKEWYTYNILLLNFNKTSKCLWK